MKLLNSLYKIVSESVSESGHDYLIALEPGHFIYKAHFPGEPITPGVCIMQIAQELLSLHFGQPLAMDTVRNIKFLKIISPVATPQVCFSISKEEISGTRVKAQVAVTGGGECYAKLSLICKAV
ncbi:MAG: hydroxymyristoyl-ACP dehydratase [Candidatus Cryptobacteroides sp.]